MKHASRAISLGAVLACVLGTMAFGIVQKAPCADGAWEANEQYRLLCYSDIVPLVGTEQLAGGRLPFLDACRESENNCDEYPVLTMYFMRIAAWMGGTGFAGFYYANALLLAGCAVAAGAALWRLAGGRALWFALAPTLFVYGTMNWDLLAVALATGTLVAWARGRDEMSGVLLGLGAAAKFYPALLVVPLFLQGMHDREPDRSVRILWWSAGTAIAVNLPFVLVAPNAWMEFFRFNAERTADWDSLWNIAADLWSAATLRTGVINVASAICFVMLAGGLWWAKARRDRGFHRWTLAFPIIVAFLLTNKVYSPQYGLWLLPLFVLAMPSFRAFAAFQVADVAVFLTRFRFFGDYAGEPWGWSQRWFQVAVLVRAVILAWCLVVWLRAETQPLVVRDPDQAVLDPVPE
ncbi:MAG: glycosyltransferase 87 family protein [Actinomycetota bacterium]